MLQLTLPSPGDGESETADIWREDDYGLAYRPYHFPVELNSRLLPKPTKASKPIL